MKILKSLFFASTVYGFCEETLIGEEPARPDPDNYQRLTQNCVNKNDEYEINIQLECSFDFKNYDPYGGDVLDSPVFSIFTVFGQTFFPTPPVEDFAEEPQIVPVLRSFGLGMSSPDQVEWFNGFGVDSSTGKGITQRNNADCVDGEFLDIKVTQVSFFFK